MEAKTKIAEGLQDMYDKLRENDEKCQREMKAANERFEAISVGKFR